MKWTTSPTLNLNDFDIDRWEERDRIQLTLTHKGKEVFTFWDNHVRELVEDGFIDYRYLLDSCVWYAQHIGLV